MGVMEGVMEGVIMEGVMEEGTMEGVMVGGTMEGGMVGGTMEGGTVGAEMVEVETNLLRGKCHDCYGMGNFLIYVPI